MTFTVGLTLSGTASKALSPSRFLCVCNSPETKCPSWLVFSCGLYNRHNKFYLIFYISDVSFDPSQMYIMDSFYLISVIVFIMDLSVKPVLLDHILFIAHVLSQGTPCIIPVYKNTVLYGLLHMHIEWTTKKSTWQ